MFKQKSDSPAGTAKVEAADVVQQARSRARHRLIGAVVLLAIGIIGFPLVFETQPRPIPVDIPIEIPRRDAAPPLVMPSARSTSPAPASAVEPAAPALPARPASSPRIATPSSAAVVATARPTVRPAEEIITESRSEAGRDVTPPRAPAPAVVPAPAPVAVPPVPATAPATSNDGARALALLEGRAVASPDAQRFVVQVGAFADADSAREARKQVEKLGLKTYTQVAQTPGGSRIRVRVGPFASRAEAEAALAKAKAAGLAAVVLTL
ncbi:MAG: SPOR domain-containing protein [Caldimonas sp.]